MRYSACDDRVPIKMTEVTSFLVLSVLKTAASLLQYSVQEDFLTAGSLRVTD